MAQEPTIRAVLFARNLKPMADFYSNVLVFAASLQDEHHVALEHSGFELIVHQIPEHIASGVHIASPPVRRTAGVLRLDVPVVSIDCSRSAAASLGGTIDTDPPAWAAPEANFFLGNGPEGNVFGVSQVEPGSSGG